MKMSLSSHRIKMIAAVAMLFDHISKVFHPFSGVQYIPYGFYLNEMMELVGRMAFPIFAYFVAIGCIKTGNIKKYSIRLAIASIISEFCYDFAFSIQNYLRYTGTLSDTKFVDKIYFWEGGVQNVCFSFLLAVLAVYCLQKYQVSLSKNAKFILLLQCIALYVIGALNQCDYWQTTIPFVLILYLAKTDHTRLWIVGAWCMIEYLLVPQFDRIPILNSPIESILFTIAAALSLIFLSMDTGKRGNGKITKYFFYCFYPMHLLLLGIIREGMIIFS